MISIKDILIQMARNSKQRRRDNLMKPADGRPLTVIYNGIREESLMSRLPGLGFYLEDGKHITRSDVYAVNTVERTLTLRLKNITGVLQ